MGEISYLGVKITHVKLQYSRFDKKRGRIQNIFTSSLVLVYM